MRDHQYLVTLKSKPFKKASWRSVYLKLEDCVLRDTEGDLRLTWWWQTQSSIPRTLQFPADWNQPKHGSNGTRTAFQGGFFH